MYSQNAEEKIILEYFEKKHSNFSGALLDIGANDGRTLSNSLALIERRWKAVLIEPDADAFEKLIALHQGNEKVICYNIAIASEDGEMDFYKSGTHLNNGDTGLLSTLSQRDYDKWKGQKSDSPNVTVSVTRLRSYGADDAFVVEATRQDPEPGSREAMAYWRKRRYTGTLRLRAPLSSNMADIEDVEALLKAFNWAAFGK